MSTAPASDDAPWARPAGGWRDVRLPRRALVLTPALFLLAAVAVGVLWWRVADPPVWVVADGVGYLDEAQRSRVFGLVAVYAACSAVPAVVLGGVLGWVQRGLSWTHVPLVVGSAVLAAVVSWRLGAQLGPDDPQDRFARLADGTRVPGALALDAYGVLLVWPLGALLALLLVGVLLVPDDRPDPDAVDADTGADPAATGQLGTTPTGHADHLREEPVADPRNL